MKRNIIRSVFLAVICILLLASCVTKSPIGDREYFQGLGLDGDFVITVNADLLDVSEYVQSEDKAVTYITERMTRLSLALVDRRTDVPPLTTEFTEFDYYGAIEGDFSKKLIDGALSLPPFSHPKRIRLPNSSSSSTTSPDLSWLFLQRASSFSQIPMS